MSEKRKPIGDSSPKATPTDIPDNKYFNPSNILDPQEIKNQDSSDILNSLNAVIESMEARKGYHDDEHMLVRMYDESHSENISRLAYKADFFRQLESYDAEPRIVPFILYLGDEYVSDVDASNIFLELKRVFCELFDSKLDEHYRPIKGSWLKEAWLKTIKGISKDDYIKSVKTAQRALEIRVVEQPEAEQTAIYANATKSLAELFANEAEVHCLIGNILYIKTESEGKSKTTVVTLSERNIKYLLNNRDAIKAPAKELLEYLEAREREEVTSMSLHKLGNEK